MKCLLVGNYGVGNLGDEALKEYFLTRFPDVEWTVLSASPATPNEVPRLPFGVRSLFAPWWKTLGAMRTCDAVVFGGGSLFTDVESVAACLLWWWHGRVARAFGKPLILAFQGIGPLRTRMGEWCARSTVSGAAFVSVRDRESAARIAGWRREPALLTFDPVFHRMAEMSRRHPAGNILAVIPRMNSGSAFVDAVRSAVADRRPDTVRILSMQPDAEEERRVCFSLLGIIGRGAEVRPVRTLLALIESLADCSHLVTERYHGALAAIALGLPVTIVAQRAGDKLDRLREQLGSGALDLAEQRSLIERCEHSLLEVLRGCGGHK